MSNVIDLNKIKRVRPTKKPDEEYSFEETIRRNKERQEELKRERKKDNRKVKRSYRLNK